MAVLWYMHLSEPREKTMRLSSIASRRHAAVWIFNWSSHLADVATLPSLAVFPAILARLEGSGFRGWYDLEVFSDDGVWGTPLEDSLLLLPEAEMLAKARKAFEAVWPRVT